MISVFGRFIFDTALGRAATALGLFGVLFATWLVKHDRKVATKAKAEIIETSKQVGKVANAKAQSAHTAARQPGAAERLRKQSCRDCN